MEDRKGNIMEQKEIRLLRANEIECRVGTISEKGLSLLLYKDARVDMKILDETFGMLGWKRTHVSIDGSLFCIIEIWDEGKQQWIAKMDVGSESFSEKEKGKASDGLKRACVSVGIGRELYTSPFIWLPAQKCRIEKKDNRLITSDRFKVQSISYNENREITGLVILNQSGNIVFSLGNAEPGQEMKEEQVEALNKELERTGVALDTVLKRYGVTSVQEMSEVTYQKALSGLKKTKEKAA